MKGIEIKKTTVEVVLKIVVTQVFFSFIYLGISLVSDAISSYNNGLFLVLITYDSLTIILVSIIQLLLINYILMQWVFEKYIIFPDKIEHRSGILFKKTDFYDTKDVATVGIEEGLMGRLFGYGSIILRSPTLEEPIELNNVPTPALIIEAIRKNVSFNKSQIVYMNSKT